MDKISIFVKNFVTYSYIGVYPKEKNRKQKLKISVILDLRQVHKEDCIKSTVSYDKIIDVLEEIKDYSHIKLLETLAKKILIKLQNIKNAKKVKIEIIKTNILKGDQDVGIILEKSLKKG